MHGDCKDRSLAAEETAQWWADGAIPVLASIRKTGGRKKPLAEVSVSACLCDYRDS